MQQNKRGFSILELVLAGAIFAVFASAIVVAVLQSGSATQAGIRAEIGRQWAQEGVEAVRAIGAQSFDALLDTAGSGVRFTNGKWEFSGNADEWDGYRRVVTVSSAQRSAGGDVVSSGGTEDVDLKLITVVVTKENFSIELSTYLSRKSIIIVP